MVVVQVVPKEAYPIWSNLSLLPPSLQLLSDWIFLYVEMYDSERPELGKMPTHSSTGVVYHYDDKIMRWIEVIGFVLLVLL